MKTNNIPATLVEGIESRIKYQYSSRMFINAAIFFGIAVVAVVVLFTSGIDQKSPLYFILGLAAVVGVIMGATTLIFTKKEMRLIDDNQRLTCYSYHFDASQNAINEDIRNHRFEHLKTLINPQDAGVRLDMLATADASVALYRLYKYVPFEYQPISEIVYVDKATADALRNLDKK